MYFKIYFQDMAIEGKTRKKIIRQLVIFFIALAAAIVVTAISADRTKIDYSKHLDDVAVTVDGVEVTLRQMGYYVMKSEENVDELALIYDPTDTSSFWRVHTNGGYVVTEAKDAAMDTCVRDMVYCMEADAAGYSLSDEELSQLSADAKDTWECLSYKQRMVLKYTEDELYDILYYVELASSYANYLLETEDFSDVSQTPSISLDLDGEYYEALLEKHKVSINKSVWSKIHLGSITITKVNISESE